LSKEHGLEDGDLYREFFNSIPDGFFQMDLNGNYLLINAAYAEIHGYPIKEMLRLNMRQTWYSEEEWGIIFREMKGKRLTNIVKHFRRKDGSSGWLELSIKTRYDADGNPEGYYGIAHDITEQRRAETSEKETRERAEFLIDLMVHDLNNINQGMMLPLEIVAHDPALPEKHKVPIEMAIAQIQRSTELIRSVKKLQLVIQQPVKLEKKDVYESVMTAAAAVKRAFPHKKIDIKIGFSSGTVYLNSDDFLPDLFFNLFHNAVKFDQKKNVKIEVSSKGENGKATLFVADHGSGIPDEEKVRVLMRKRGGRSSGVGLTLVKYLIERYNGTISLQNTVEGKPSKGTVVCMTFREEN
jgi:PAS domain S-box-containing protein